MLIELMVKNFAIIDEVHISFQSGLNILSGETGAGKSVLLKSLSLMMGEKSSTDVIRSGKDQAIVEGAFDISRRSDIKAALTGLGIESSEDLLVVKRVLMRQGKSRIYINGTMSTLATLQGLIAPLVEVTGHSIPLIEMTGQHDSRNLLSKSYHMDLLDRYAGALELKHSYSESYRKFKSIEQELERLNDSNRNHEQRLDFLSYQLNEIESLNLSEGDDELLERQYNTARSSERLNQFLNETESSLFGEDDSAIARVHKVIQKAKELEKYGLGLFEKIQPLENVKTVLEDVIFDVRHFTNQAEAEGLNIQDIESKMAKYRKLQRKYGTTLQEILSAQTSISNELDELKNRDQIIESLTQEKSDLEKNLKKVARSLSEKRKKYASMLAKSVNGELEDLNMKGVQLVVSIEPLEEINSTGQDSVQFRTKNSNQGDEKALNKAASGGELSRILLSLKYTVGDNEKPRTYLFDEVDNGVSGETAEKVGKKLKAISGDQQVICVTHLAQVAHWADSHYLIKKTPAKTGVKMSVLELKKRERVEEIARLISGEKITKTSLAHAEQLISQNSLH